VPEESSESFYTREGTHAHTLAALLADRQQGKISEAAYEEAKVVWTAEGEAAGFDTVEITEYITDVYLPFLMEAVTPATIMYVERELDAGVGGIAGTGDAVLLQPDTGVVHVIDLKYGKGVYVSAVGNPQLRLYGLGALRLADVLGGFDQVWMTIVQPRLGNITTERLTVTELLAWRDEVVVPGVEATKAAVPTLNPGPVQCRWCPAAGMCQARADQMLARERFFEASVLDDAALASIVGELADVRIWCDQIEAEALTRANRGHLPGWKVVRSGSRRSISDGAAAIAALVAAGYPLDAVQRVQVETLGRLERLVGKANLLTLLGDLIVKSEGTKSLAPEDDPRPAATDIEEDFA
jgi:hypothetical protein